MKSFIYTLAVLASSSLFAQENKYFQSIVGTWVHRKDTNVKWVFDDSGNCKWYKEDVITAAFSYELSPTSIACNINQSSPHYQALRLMENTATSRFNYNENAESVENYCYYVNGITAEILSLTSQSGGVYVLQKQTNPFINQYYEKIIGTWIERDSKNGDDKWIFNADKTAEVYLKGKLFAKYDKYEIVRTSEECRHTTFYDDIYILKMEENALTSPTDYKIENVGPIVYDCSYINGIEDELISLSSTVKGGPPLILIRQKSLGDH
ncbi:hypothetical protein [Ekhidna sp.]|uniref:hypothetical protein n=1 Tax=Ekhidna sp. TaxID=2608089 RepID=UPI003296922B